MTFLGLSFMWWCLLGSFGLVAILSVICFHIEERGEQRRARIASIPTITSLPRAIAVPTKWRKTWWS